MRPQKNEQLVRHESSSGHGLFQACREFLDLAVGPSRFIRSRTNLEREIESIITWLRNHTDPVPAVAYKDGMSRYPCTWFRSTATGHIRRSDRLSAILNREGMNIRRIERPMPICPLWQDEVQVVTRRPRGNRALRLDSPTILSIRAANRRSKQAKRRARAGRLKARRVKSGIEF